MLLEGKIKRQGVKWKKKILELVYNVEHYKIYRVTYMRIGDYFIQWWRMRVSARWIPPGCRILDIGCHQGEFLDFLGDAVVVEPAVDRNAHMVLSDPSGRFLFVPATGPNRVMQYRFDVDSGRLAPNDPPFVEGGAPDAQPRHMAFHPSGRFAYVINEKDTSSGWPAARGSCRWT